MQMATFDAMKLHSLRIVTLLLLSHFLFIFAGCDNFEHHPYAVKIDGPTGINEASVSDICGRLTSLPLRFAFITDTQGAYDELEDAIADIRTRRVDFIVHGGDQTDFGLPKEFMWCRDLMNRAGVPYITIIGNHDCVGNGEATFAYIYGRKNFSFTVAGVHFVCLNTNALEYDYSEPVPDLNFIEADAAEVNELNAAVPGSVTHTVAVMHSRPYDEQFNNNVAKPFLFYLKSYPGMREDAPEDPRGGHTHGFCINGHNHSMSISEIGDAGILFYQCPNMAKRCYFIFTLTADGYEMETVDY